MQLDLIPAPNPLILRFGKDFFDGVPEKPGIYVFKDENDEVLYVGKSKNLRKRLGSYRYLKPQNAGKKKWRLVHLIQDIEWFEQDSEIEALKAENDIIDLLKPKYNSLNKFPEYYHYLNLSLTPNALKFSLQSEMNKDASLILGAFKSRKYISPILNAYIKWAEFLQNPSRKFVLSESLKEDWTERFLKIYHTNTVIELIETLKGESTQFIDRCLALGQSNLVVDCPLTKFTLIEHAKTIRESYDKIFSKKRYMIPNSQINLNATRTTELGSIAMGDGFVLKHDLNNWLVDSQSSKLRASLHVEKIDN